LRILCESDSPRNVTGFAHVARYLYHYFCHLGHDIIAVGWQTLCSPILECAKCDYDLIMHKEYKDRCKQYTLVPGGPNEAGVNGMYTFNEYKQMYRPDLIFSFCDINWLPYIPREKKETPWMAYFPIDGDHWNESWNPLFDKCDYKVTYSKFAQEVCKKHGYDDVDMIYHGCDPLVFKQFSDDIVQESRKMNFKPRGMKPDSFVVGTIQTPNPRKNWESWLISFAKFAEDKDDVIAVLITDPGSPMSFNARIDMRRTIITLGIKDKIWMPGTYHYWGSYNDKQMAEIINWFRYGCYFTVSGGEGFGLPQFQSMHCGVPVVALDYTTPTEFLADGRGYLIKQGEWFNPDGFDRPLPDIGDAVEKLNDVYYNPEKAKRTATKGMAWAKRITWNTTMYQWAKKFKEIGEDL